MAESVSVSLTAGQAVVFRQLAQRELDAKQVLSNVDAARNAAAMMVVLAQYPPELVQGAQLQIGEEEISFTPNAPATLVE